ncbi:MAG: PQQ-dependent sugar dehydrogenase [Gammaproteobacteria bacterium]|nr:PQQ-dependent sugar dehydrogenase [Gammaproteobacteria bacterium]
MRNNGLMRPSFLSALLAAMVLLWSSGIAWSQQPGEVVVASMRDWSPDAGWEFLWNQNGPLGDDSAYVPMQWDGAEYASGTPSGLPFAFEFAWASISTKLLSPGRGLDDGEAEDRYLIVRYAVTASGNYSLANSSVEILQNICSTGMDLAVLVNNAPVTTTFVDPETVGSFDLDLGTLLNGDTIDVAFGPAGDPACDLSAVDWDLVFTPPDGGSIVAGFGRDWQVGPAPADGWDYLWNENDVLGNASGYSDLPWAALQYVANHPSGSPALSFIDWFGAKTYLVQPGPGTQQGESRDLYAIARYTVPGAGSYYLLNSNVGTINDSCGNGIEIVILINDIAVATERFSRVAEASFNRILGTLAEGDTIDVALGPNGDSDCDISVIDWDFYFVSAQVDYSFETLPSGLVINVDGVARTTPFTLSLPIGADIDIAAGNQGLFIFDSWSIGGLAAQQVTVGVAAQILTASYTDLSAGDGAVIADFLDDWTNGPAPPAGWAYLWNASSPLGDPSGYSALQWDGVSQYLSSDPSGLPSASVFTWGDVTAYLAQPGLGIQEGEQSDRHLVARYTVASDGAYYLVNSSIVVSGGCSNGVEVTVLVNNTTVSTRVIGPSTSASFDIGFGTLSAGDTIDVALGPNGDGSCDVSTIDWGIFRVPNSGQFGLAERPSNPSCVAPPRPTGGASVDTELAIAGSPGFTNMTKILQAPGDGSRWFVLQQQGVVQVLNINDPENPEPYLNIIDDVRSDGGEEGLLGMAFHPQFPAVPEVYLSYTAGATASLRHSRISRFILDDTDSPTSYTEQILLTVDQPDSNHNGGDIAFGPDGYLYIGLGDGGGGGDPWETGQDTTNLLGAMLRIDVLGVPFPSPAYRIPPDNPFADSPNNCGPTLINDDDCPEIYAWGLRNPWRWSFDEPTGMLWLGDVGQNQWEEVDIIERGGNYGWDCRESFSDYELEGCPTGGLIDPVTEYGHSFGNVSITGGYVYRGSAIPGLVGRYVFADWGSGRIWALQDDGQGGYSNELIVNTPYNPAAFAIGADGELYFADRGMNRIRRLIPAGAGNPDTIPDNLVDTGCVDINDPTQPGQGLIPYTINAPFWSDGAAKSRWLAIPDGTTIDVDGDEDLVFPERSVIVKNFYLDSQLIETRLLMRHPDGIWAGYTYAWDDLVTTATRVIGGSTRLVGNQSWIYPSEGECMQCHTSAAGFSLGPELAQLNGNLIYPSTGINANQVDTLDNIAMFTSPLPGPAATLPALPDPADTGATLDERARSYLHTNCSQCHRPNGPTPSNMDLRYDTALSATNACAEPPASSDLGIGLDARLIAPGVPEDSVIPVRMGSRDAHGMPPLGSTLADAIGVALINAWIESLSGCN